MPDESHAITPAPADVQRNVIKRATEVQKKLRQIGNTLEDSYLDMCDLLAEAHDGAYHTVWGFGRFGDWVEQGSGLDVSARHAYYCVSISRTVKKLGLDRDAVKKAKISKLKAIIQLDPEQHADDIKELVESASDMNLDQVQDAVRKLLDRGEGDRMVAVRFKVPSAAKDVIDEAIVLARQNYGSTIRNGEVAEASDGQCLEMIAASYLAEPEHHSRPEFGADREEQPAIQDEIEIETEG